MCPCQIPRLTADRAVFMAFNIFNQDWRWGSDNPERRHEYFGGKEHHQQDILTLVSCCLLSGLLPQRWVQTPRTHYVYPSSQFYNLSTQRLYESRLFNCGRVWRKCNKRSSCCVAGGFLTARVGDWRRRRWEEEEEELYFATTRCSL